MNKILNEIADELLSCKDRSGSILLYPHIGVDGDGLGSALALLLALRRSGLRVRLFLDEPIPDRLSFLPHLDLIEPYDSAAAMAIAVDQILAVAIDCADGNRVGQRQDLFDRAPRTAVLDHHVSGGESGGLRLIDASAAAVGEIAFDLICLLEDKLQTTLMDSAIATLLMTAIISDTGGFVYSNTSARTFSTAASLMHHEVNLRQITYQLFDLTSQERMRLMGRLFTDARFSHQGRLALALVDQELLEKYGATDNDLEGIISHLRNVAGVEVAFLVREMKDGTLRVNIRSSDHFNAADFARKFGGGGHPKAAGLQFSGMTISEAVQTILDKAGEWL